MARTVAFALTLLTGGPAQAQRLPPNIGYVYPAGGQQGTTFTISIGGQMLSGTNAAYFSGRGVQAEVISHDRPFSQKEINDLREKLQQLQAKRTAARDRPNAPAFTSADEKSLEDTRLQLATRGARPANPALAETLTLEITLAPDAALGNRELRIKSPTGLSNPIVFCVGPLPETTDPVVTATAKPPPRRTPPNGKRPNTPGKREPKVVLPALVNGQILPGEVDRFHFAARQGQRITIMTAARALIPYLADAVPGWFQPTLAVFDSAGREVAYADDFRFHPDPVLVCEIPADDEYAVEIKDAIYRGREDFVYRIAIGELPFVSAIFPLGGQAGKNLRVETQGWNLPLKELTIDTLDQGRGIFELAVRGGQYLSNPVRFAIDEPPALMESEPNDSMAAAQFLMLPVTVDGRIGTAGDADVFGFETTEPAVVVADLLARRLNSPVDSVVEVFDATGRRLAINDDLDDKAAGLLTHHADSQLEVTLPSAGVYFVRVTDAQRKGGAEFGYRLRLRAPEPDFALRIVPSTLNVRAGGTITLTAYALRRDGFNGEIALALKDAPRGFYLSGNRIPANEEKVQLTLTAPPNPLDEPLNLTLVGVATAGGKRFARAAVPAEDKMQAFAYRHLVTSQELKVQLTGRGPTARVLTRMPVALPPGGVARIRFGSPAARSVGEVKLELLDPPPGIAIVRCDSNAHYIEVLVSCDAAKIKPGTQGNLIFQVVSGRANTTEGKAKSGAGRAMIGIVPAIPFEVAESPKPST
jgi:hypothetical protein